MNRTLVTKITPIISSAFRIEMISKEKKNYLSSLLTRAMREDKDIYIKDVLVGLEPMGSIPYYREKLAEIQQDLTDSMEQRKEGIL